MRRSKLLAVSISLLVLANLSLLGTVAGNAEAKSQSVSKIRYHLHEEIVSLWGSCQDEFALDVSNVEGIFYESLLDWPKYFDASDFSCVDNPPFRGATVALTIDLFMLLPSDVPDLEVSARFNTHPRHYSRAFFHTRIQTGIDYQPKNASINLSQVKGKSPKIDLGKMGNSRATLVINSGDLAYCEENPDDHGCYEEYDFCTSSFGLQFSPDSVKWTTIKNVRLVSGEPCLYDFPNGKSTKLNLSYSLSSSGFIRAKFGTKISPAVRVKAVSPKNNFRFAKFTANYKDVKNKNDRARVSAQLQQQLANGSWVTPLIVKGRISLIEKVGNKSKLVGYCTVVDGNKGPVMTCPTVKAKRNMRLSIAYGSIAVETQAFR